MRTLLAAVMGGLLLSGCGAPAGGGGGPTPAPGTPPATASVSGDWTLVHQLSPQALGGGTPTTVRGALRLAQSGTTVTGTYTLEQPPTAVAVAGTVSGRSLSLTIGPVALSGGSLSLADSLTLGATGQAASGSTVATANLGSSTLTTPGTCSMERR